MARQLRELVPEAMIVVGHGQMPENELEKVMLDFLHHRAKRVALFFNHRIRPRHLDGEHHHYRSGRPVWSGAALPIAGRVGRSAVRAYAYLLIPGEHLLTEDARKRLDVLQELDDLGQRLPASGA